MSILRSFFDGIASIGQGMASIFSAGQTSFDRTIIDRETILKNLGSGNFTSTTSAEIVTHGGPKIEATPESVAQHLERAAKQWDENARRWRAVPFPETGEAAAKDSENVAQQYRDLARDVREGRATFTVKNG